MMIVVNL